MTNLIVSAVKSFKQSDTKDKIIIVSAIIGIISFIPLLHAIICPSFDFDIKWKDSLSLEDSIVLTKGENDNRTLIVTGNWGLLPLRLIVFGKIFLCATNLPKGVSISLSPHNEWPPIISEARINISRDASIGSYKIAICGFGPFNFYHNLILDLNIIDYKYFGLECDPKVVSAKQGSITSTNIHIYRNNLYRKSVNLNVSGAPIGTTVKLDPEYLLPDTSVAKLVIQVSPNASTGQYSLLVTGKGDEGENSSCKFDLIIEPNRGFNLFIDPAFNSVGNGGYAIENIMINSTKNYTGKVKLSAIKLPNIVKNISFYPPVVQLSSTYKSNHSVAKISIVENTDIGGCREIIINGRGVDNTSSNCSSTLCVEKPEKYFMMYINPLSMDAIPGESDIPANIIVKSINGYEGFVDLKITQRPNDVEIFLNKTPLQLSSSNLIDTSTAKIKVGQNVQSGIYTITVRGDGSNHTFQERNLILTIDKKDFNLSVNQPMEVNPGGKIPVTVIASGENGYSGIINLEVINRPDDVDISFDPPSLQLSPNTPKLNSTATINVGQNTQSGNYNIAIKGTGSNNTSQECNFMLKIIRGEDFKLTVSQPNEVIPGGEVPATITINGINGYSGSINLTTIEKPDNVEVSFDPASLDLSPNDSELKSIAKIKASQSVQSGNYTIIVMGVGYENKSSSTCTLKLYIKSIEPEKFEALPLAPETKMNPVSGCTNDTIDEDGKCQIWKSSSGKCDIVYPFKLINKSNVQGKLKFNIVCKAFPKKQSQYWPKLVISIYNYETYNWDNLGEAYNLGTAGVNFINDTFVKESKYYLKDNDISIKYELRFQGDPNSEAEFWIDKQKFE